MTVNELSQLRNNEVSLPSEDNIMSSWCGNVDKPIISICCITYNHEDYIEDTIVGFLIQKTEFPFEILIHDDASTDNTGDIIRQYQERYPRLIKPIFQKDNKYSQGEKVNHKYNFPRALGIYIALCEGDDYWTDVRKLQLQVEKMIDTGVGMSFHASATLKGNILASSTNKYEEKIYSEDELMSSGYHFVQTNTIIFCKSALSRVEPGFWEKVPVGDFFIRLVASHKTGAYCLPLTMGVYRVQSVGSWTAALEDVDKLASFIRRMIAACDEFNCLYDDVFYDLFVNYKSRLVKSLMLKIGDDSALMGKYKEEFYPYLIFVDKVKVFVLMSSVFRVFSRVKSRFVND